jgi:hypothetical protein
MAIVPMIRIRLNNPIFAIKVTTILRIISLSQIFLTLKIRCLLWFDHLTSKVAQLPAVRSQFLWSASGVVMSAVIAYS